MGFEFNVQPMTNALRWYAEVRVEKDLAYCVNKKMKDVVIKTMQNTPRVARATISDQLQQYYATKAYVLTGKRAGQRMKHPKPLYRPWPLARAIIAARLWKKGINPHSLSGQTFADKIDAMIKSRLSSGSYGLSGWIPAAKMFGAGLGFGSASQWTVSGSGTLADVNNAVAEIRNDAVVNFLPGSKGYQEMFQAAQDALNDVAEETLAFADDLLNKGWEDMAKQMR